MSAAVSFRFALLTALIALLSGAAVIAGNVVGVSLLLPGVHAQTEFLQLKPGDKAPVTCDAVHVGAVAADRDGRLCSCRKLGDTPGLEAAFAWSGMPMGQVCGLVDK